jgi:two-component system response regulator RegA
VEALRLGAAHYLTKPADVDEIIAGFAGAAGTAVGPAGRGAGDESSVPSLARVEWEHIQRVLADCGGNVSKAARLLGVHRRSLQRKLAKYPVNR